MQKNQVLGCDHSKVCCILVVDYVEFEFSTIWIVIVVFLYVLVVDFIEFDCSTIVELDWIL